MTLYCQGCNQKKATFIRVLPKGSGSFIQLLCLDCVEKLDASTFKVAKEEENE